MWGRCGGVFRSVPSAACALFCVNSPVTHMCQVAWAHCVSLQSWVRLRGGKVRGSGVRILQGGEVGGGEGKCARGPCRQFQRLTLHRSVQMCIGHVMVWRRVLGVFGRPCTQFSVEWVQLAQTWHTLFSPYYRGARDGAARWETNRRATAGNLVGV